MTTFFKSAFAPRPANAMILAVVLGALAPLAAPAQAQNPAPAASKQDWQTARERLVFLLSGYEFFPSRAQLDEVAPPEVLEKLLVDLAADGAQPPSMRTKAVDAMGFYQSAAHVAFLQSVLSSPLPAQGSPERRGARSLKHHALMSVAKVEGEGSVKRLEPFLAHEDLQFRLTAINALGKHGGATGLKLLQDVRAKDTNLAVQREVAKFLEAGPAAP